MKHTLQHRLEMAITGLLVSIVVGLFVFKPSYQNGRWHISPPQFLTGQVVFSCGDGVITFGEQCDDGNMGDGDGCSSACEVEPGYNCMGEPSTCTGDCGNGVLDGAEECDDNNVANGDGCDNTCEIEVGYTCSGAPSTCELECGNGTVDAGESCDDGNTNNGDGCSSTCVQEPGYQCSGVPSVCTDVCGNGVIGGTEECDDGNTTAGDGCNATCAIETGYSCYNEPSTCTSTCGNGVLNFGEECDDGNMSNGDGCSAVCTNECGNGVLDAGEQCDDGNTNNGDGCSSTCTNEVGPTCGDGIINGAEQCDDGVGNSDTTPDACRTNCTLPVCGDAVADTGEQCDDGNNSNTDDCLNTCINYTCGDGYIHETKEQCEPPGVEDVCTDYCKVWTGGGGGGGNQNSSQTKIYQSEINTPTEGCGNGIVQPDLGEQCDNGAKNGQGNCSASCQLLFCGDLEYSPNLEECEPAPFANPDGTLFYKVPECGNFCVPPDETQFSPTQFCTYLTQEPCDEESQVFEENYCGNGVVDSGEQCDQGSICEGGVYNQFLLVNDLSIAACYEGGGVPLPVGGDGCSDECTLELCGDGTLQARGADGILGTADDEQCDNGSICSDTGLPCSNNTECNEGAQCVYNLDVDPECNARCKTTQCQYSYRLELPELDPSTHTLRLTVTDSRGISAVDTTVFSISETLDQLSKAATAKPSLFASILNGLRLTAQVQPSSLTTTVTTDISHYLQNRDSHAVVSCTVYDENGNRVCDLPPEAFALEIDGLLVEEAEFTETTFGFCGDGARQGAEECDDGNTIDDDTCSNLCLSRVVEFEPEPNESQASCPNGVVEVGEQCDDGNTLNGDGCSIECRTEERCGDGIVQSNEQCDDGNTLSSDGCSNICETEELVQTYCGDGQLDDNEECDDGSANSLTTANACRTTCVEAHCGDGVLDMLEQCDSGSGNAYESNTCRPTCMLPTCGDGIIDLGEQCDGGEFCSASCTILSQPICGNGRIEDPETCDDGNTQSGDGCNSVCATEVQLHLANVCGNGTVEFGEQCDDGNISNTDNCSTSCKVLQQTSLFSSPTRLPLATITPMVQLVEEVPATGPGLALIIALSSAFAFYTFKRKRPNLSNQSELNL